MSTTLPTPPAASDTAFNKEVLEFRKGRIYRPADAAGLATIFLVGGVVSFLLAPGVLNLLIGTLAPGTQGILQATAENAPVLSGILVSAYWLLCGTAILTFLFQFGNAVASPCRKIVCPRCSHPDKRVFHSVRQFICEQCLALLLLGSNHGEGLRAVDCAYCGHTSYATKDHGVFPCPDCGVAIDSATATVADASTIVSCSTCGTTIPASAVHCVSCRAIRLPEYQRLERQGDKHWDIGKSTAGHVTRANALLQAIESATSTANDLEAVSAQFLVMEKALVSLETVLLDERTVGTGRHLMEVSDKAYSHVVAKALAWVREKPEATYPPKGLKAFVDQSYLAQRRRIERIALQRSRVWQWREDLIVTKEIDSIAKGQCRTVIGFDNLALEQTSPTWVGGITREES